MEPSYPPWAFVDTIFLIKMYRQMSGTTTLPFYEMLQCIGTLGIKSQKLGPIVTKKANKFYN